MGLSNLQKYERVKDFLKYIETPFQIYLKIIYVSKLFNYELRYEALFSRNTKT